MPFMDIGSYGNDRTADKPGPLHRKMGLRIDLALISQSLVPGLERCGIERNTRKGSKPSDHAPLVVELSP